MTREEAWNRIDAIIAKHEIDDVYVTITNFMDYDALRIARKTLEQEPCEDCISRKAAEEITWEEPSYTDALNVLAEVREKIRQLPPITPQPKTDVLDKIKTEIEEQVLESLSDGGDDWFVAEKVNECLEIIDKYTAESEE